MYVSIICPINTSIMAKVVAPLQSFSASGKIGKSLVFFSHLGRNVVRGLVTPANPQSTGQGSSRLLLGALGRSNHGVANPSDYRTQARLATAAGQTSVSTMIKNVVNFFGSGNTGNVALQAAVDGHIATNWEAQAATLGLTDLTISYAAVTGVTLTAGAQLYALAYNATAIYASDPAVFNVAPITTALASWSSANVVAFVALCNSVA